MNKLLRIISFEYKNIAFKKAFIITTLIMSIIVLGISVERVSCTNKRRTHAYQNQFSSFKEENNCGGCGAC